MRRLALVGFAGWMVGCGINDKDLQVAAKAFYSPKTSTSQLYKLLSTPSRQQITESEFEDANRSGDPVEFQVTILGEETQGNNTYGKVMLTSTAGVPGAPCKVRETRTWVKDDGRWRVLYFPKLRK